MRCAVSGWRDAERPPERRGERADAAKPDGEADVHDRPVSIPEQGRRAFHSAHQQVLVRRLAERPAELPAEGAGESRAARASIRTSSGSR
jgi:hypothetical protein